jgi:hypothetical protein
MLLSAAEYRESLRPHRPVRMVPLPRSASSTDPSLRHDEIAAD